MNRKRICLLALPLVLAACAASAVPPAADAAAAPAGAEAELLKAERRWLDAYERHDQAAMDEILADDFVIAYPDGRTMDKAAVMAQLRQAGGPSDIRFSTEGTQVQVTGDSATLSGIFVMQSPRGMRRSRYTDRWQRRGSGWQVVSSVLSRLSE